MFESMLDQVKTWYTQYSEFTQSNQMLGAAVGATVVGSLLYVVKTLPMKIISSIKRRLIVGVDVYRDDDYFNRVTYDRVSKWVEARTVKSLSRRIGIGNGDGGAHIQAGTGTHYFWSGWRLFWCKINKDANNNADMYKFSLSIETFAMTTKPIRKIIEQASAKEEKPKDSIIVRHSSSDGWTATTAQKRHASTVAMSQIARRLIFDSIRKFEVSSAQYFKMGIGYKMGILLEGPPGTGKTSIIRAIATETGRDIYTLNLAACTDSQLMQRVMSIPPGAILALEDIDCIGAFASREAAGKNDALAMPIGCSLSGVLNVLDGIRSPYNLITIMTTNHPEKIDPAILRKGRTDLRIHIGDLDSDAINEYCRNTIGEAVGDVRPMTGCELQSVVMQCDMEPERIKAALVGR